MSEDTKYKSLPWLFDSKGLMARPSLDRPPNEHFYLNMDGCFEREESAISSRYGSTIINRDPVGALTFNNYLLPFAPVVLSRLKALSGQTYRYAGLASGGLYRRATDIQGIYSQIASGLSGLPFTTVVATPFASSQPYLFLFDRVKMLKDTGTGSPTRIGIFPPVRPVIATQYGPQIMAIDSFQSAAGYAPSNMTLVGLSTVTIINGSTFVTLPPAVSASYAQYNDPSNSFINAVDGMLGSSVNVAGNPLGIKFSSNVLNQTYDWTRIDGVSGYQAPDQFKFQEVTFSIASNTTGFIGKTLPLNLLNYQPDDLFVVVLKVDNPANVQEIRVQFDVNGSVYSSSYYYKSLIPVSYQGNLSLPQANDPTSAMVSEVFNRVTGVTNLAQLGNRQLLPPDDPNLPIIQPSQLSSGQGSWSVVYLRKGDFLPAGNASEPGLDWSNITGWRIQVTTNSQGSANVSFNGLYLQGSPTSTGVGTNAGASSYGGVGYDFRYTYINLNTLTESNPCPEAYFSITPQNQGGESTLVPLRQAIDLQMQYSADPQVTHIQVYVRGGIYGDNWYYADRVPNIVSTAVFDYKYILPDSALSQGNILKLTNDVPVTSTLQNPINTTLSVALNPVPANTNIPTLLTVNVANLSAVFVTGQIVDIGTPQNLEQVSVVSGGTGTFTAYIQLPHAIGEQVQVYAIPAQPLYLAALAYNQIYMAGDPNNPHFLYYTPVGYPENCPPQNYIPIGSASDPITAVINFRGTLFVRTLSTWWQIFPGNPPYAQTTGSKHGSPASFDWCITESEIWYQAWDGIRTFKGVDGAYRSLLIEWLFRNNTLTPVTVADLTKLSQTISAFKNNTAYIVYTGIDGNPHRINFNTQYHRWRNDDIPVTAIYLETDTNTLLYAKPITIGGVSGWAIVKDDINLDYDDGGWVAGALAKLPIPLNLQTPYLDQNAPNNQKQYNVLTIDANPNGQVLNPTLLFDDNNGSVPPIVLPPFTGAIRQKFSFQINAGFGQPAYRMSMQIQASVIAAPIIYQADIYAAELADVRNAYDTYWIKFGFDESQLIKQAYFDYTTADGNSIIVSLYADGATTPYFSFALQPNTARAEVPTRVRFPAMKCRMWRMVAVSIGQFQFWAEVEVNWKPILGPNSGKGYMRKELGDLTPTPH